MKLATLLLGVIAFLQLPVAAEGYFCPMHPDVTASTPGACWKCGMALVRGNPREQKEFFVDVETSPRSVRAGQRATLRIRLLDPVTFKAVNALQPIHDAPLRLHLVSRDLRHFLSVVPAPATGAEFSVDVTFPAAGSYRAHFEFFPRDGVPQMVRKTISVRRGASGGTEPVGNPRVRARLISDRVKSGVRATLHFEISGSVSAVHAFVTDRSGDGLKHLHADAANSEGEVSFNTIFDRTGSYRVWLWIDGTALPFALDVVR